ncbi:AAA family ATPase [Singulisphaera sp. Ch08]|uniref:AAA family ATPase n=1 Tax=Singulisphaera sp. Ch08 TaxID=3120278 RepID=A0AAU7CSQ0_9BACT
MEVVVFIGLQGSGKSTFYRSNFAPAHVLVSKDLFRNNRRPQRRQAHLIEEALCEGRSVVVDNTNPTVEDRAAIISIARTYGAKVIGFYFDSSVKDCVERNGMRTGKEKVPDAAIFITEKRLRPPTLDEGFDRLWRVRLTHDCEVVVREYFEEDAR